MFDFFISFWRAKLKLGPIGSLRLTSMHLNASVHEASVHLALLDLTGSMRFQIFHLTLKASNSSLCLPFIEF